MLKVVLVGRPNVGKSTLFNRLVRSQKAIVNDQPGVTRDRKYGQGKLADLEFTLIDTAGIDDSLKGRTEVKIKEQSQFAIDDANVIFFVIDGREGVLPIERSIAINLKKKNKPIIVLVNKSEGLKGLIGLSESTSLGFDIVIPISAEHGEGLPDLYDVLKNYLHYQNIHIKQDEIFFNLENTPIRVSIIGRPNTGKSTLLNNIIGENRLVTGSEAGITRDSIEIEWNYKKQTFCLIDTAGLRRKSKITKILEKHMVSDTLKSIKFSDICVLLVDASQNIDKQDLTIARMIIGEGRGIVIGANKWDKITDQNSIKNKIINQLGISLSQIKKIPIVFLSGLHSKGIKNLFDEIIYLKQKLTSRITTGKLNRWLSTIIENNPPPLYKGRQNNIRYITQVNVKPPTFALFMSSPDDLPNSYKRFLLGSIVKTFDLQGIPIRIMFRKGNNPYVKK
tara:strand:- start:883 stop:2232 length:1350 start_codon:yes stop_codon:yes gene_type:complete